MVFLAVIFFIAGCTKNPPTPDPIPTPDPVNPVIVITGLPADSVIYGDSVSFSWNIKNYVSATLNGAEIKAIDSKSTGRLLNDTIYEIKAVGPYGGTADTSFTIKVKDWKSSKFGLITHGYWVVYSFAYKLDTMPDYIITNSGSSIDPRNKDMEEFYYPDGTTTLKSKSGAFQPITSRWRIIKDSLEISDDGNVGRSLIDSISPQKMVLIRKSVFLLDNIPIPCLYKDVYIHGKD